MNKQVMAQIKKNDSKVKAAMKSAGVKVGQAISPAKMKQVMDLATGTVTTTKGGKNNSLIALAQRGAAYRTPKNQLPGKEAEVKGANIRDGKCVVTYGDGTVVYFKADAANLTPSVSNNGFIGYPMLDAKGKPMPDSFSRTPALQPKNPKAAAALAKSKAEAAVKPAGKGKPVSGIDTTFTVVGGKAAKTAGPGKNKGAKGEAFCSKCGRDNGRPASPDCRNVAACKARVEKAQKAKA